MMSTTLILSIVMAFVDAPTVSLDAAIERLDAPRWVERESAMYEIAHVSSGVTAEQITDRLQQGGLSLEQVVRLLRAVEIRKLHSPRGAVGIQMAPARRLEAGDLLRVDRLGVEIMAVIPNMPAEGLIKPGDLITHIDGIPLRTQEDLARVVQRHWPGDVLPFRVLRPVPNIEGAEPELIEVAFDLTLGSTDVLASSGSGMNIRDPGYSARLTEVSVLQERFGPVPTRVPAPAVSGALSTSSQGSEEDQVVAGALRLLVALEAGTTPMTREQARASWLETITRTEAMLSAPGMEPEERQRLRLRVQRLRAIYDSTSP
jgi:hypothetical protein